MFEPKSKVYIINIDCCTCGKHTEIASFYKDTKIKPENLANNNWAMTNDGRYYCDDCLSKLYKGE